MIASILALISCFQTKRNLLSCDHAQYDAMTADYELIMSLYGQFVSNGQAAITLGQEDILKELLKLLKKWGCQNDAILDEPLSSVNWCLCGGGGASIGKYTYSAGNEAMVSTTVDAAASFTKSGGVGTFTMSSGILLGGTVRGLASDAIYNSNGATDSFKLVIPVKNADYAYATLIVPLIQVWDTSNSSGISDTFPLVLDMGAVQRRIVDISSETISIVFTGIGAMYPSGWAITFVTP